MLRWIYPITCELCGESAERSICPDCLAKLARVPRPICLNCGAPLRSTPESTEACPACFGKPRPYSFVRSALIGNEQNMQLIYRLKYHHAIYLATGLAPALAELQQSIPEPELFRQAVIVPVPTTPTHQQQRGYNQAGELARELGKILGLKVVPVLQRHETEFNSQTRLSARQRLLNAYRSFSALPAYKSGKRPLPPSILLVDDVYTTGATTRACSRALLRLPGVERVGVLTLVRAELHSQGQQKNP